MAVSKHFNHKCCSSFLGLLYIFLCCLFTTISSVVVKKMTYVSTGQLSLMRNAGILVWSIPIAVYRGKNLLGPKNQRFLLLTRGILAASALYFNLLAYRYLPLVDASIIISTTPAIVMIAARMFLKESCGIISICGMVLTFAGVLLSVNIPQLMQNRETVHSTTKYITGIVWAVSGVIFLAFTTLSVRKMRNVHYSVILIYVGIAGSIENSCLTAAFSVYKLPHCGGWDSLLMLSVAVSGFAAHVFFILAIQTEAAGIISIVRAGLDIIIALVFQVIFFSHYPNVYNMGGAVMVILAVGAIGMSKCLQQLPEESKLKRKLKFLLL